MRRSIWLASYPKSGNTWFRLLLANLVSGDDRPVDINRIDSTEMIASARGRFDNHLLIESGMLTHDEIDRLRPGLYAHLAGLRQDDAHEEDGGYPVRFVKTHDAYTMTGAGEPLMGGARGAAGALLLVRDPRDVAGSLANHRSIDLDRATAFMGDPAACFAGGIACQRSQLRQRLLDWSGHGASWLDQADIPVHLVRYEDMLADPAAALGAALAFAGWPASDRAIGRAIRGAAIGELQRQEAESGFREAPGRCVRFFRRGAGGGWRDELDSAQLARIERDHAPMMRRLGYAVAADAARRKRGSGG